MEASIFVHVMKYGAYFILAHRMGSLWLCELPYHFSSSSNIAVIVLGYKKGRSTWTKRLYFIKTGNESERKPQAYI